MTRPLETWRICGNPVADPPGCGCTCGPNDPTRWAAEKALARLETEEGGAVRIAPRAARGARKAGSRWP